MPSFKSAKVIFDPLWGITNISDFLPMIDVEAFQALGFKYQLGVTSTLFPAATHTRKQHSFGAFQRTQELADRWLHRGFITKEQAKLMTGYALWHDIGHGPFSHVVEEVTKELWGRDHDKNGALILNDLQNAVKNTGIDFDALQRLFSHKDPLYLAVHDKNLGSEKLDYLSRDAYYTIGEAPGVEYLAYHTYFIDNNVVIDERAIDQAKSIQEFYVKMYKTVYLRKNSVIAQRLTQKMMMELLHVEPMIEQELWSLTDFGLLGRFETSANPMVRDYYRRLMRRDIPKTAVALRPEKFSMIEQAQEKAQTTLSVPQETLENIARSPDLIKPSKLEAYEQEIAKIAGLPKGSVLVVPPTSVERFRPQDILIHDPSSTAPTKLSEIFPDHYQSLTEQGRAYMVLRVCTFEKYREKLSRPDIAKAIKEYFLAQTTI